MALHAPEIAYDYPLEEALYSARRGYRATIKRGSVAFRDREAVLTRHDALRGKLLRGAQAARAPRPMASAKAYAGRRALITGASAGQGGICAPARGRRR